MASKRVLSPNLDLLRALAVTCVFVSHLVGVLGYRIGSLGRFGVILFFIHTTLVLMESLERMQAGGGNLTAAFWVRRLFRIYPLAIFVVLAVTAFHIPGDPGSLAHPRLWPAAWQGWPTFLANLTLTQNLTYRSVLLSPLWSLPLEVQMYVLLPFVFFAIRGRRYRSFWLWAASVPLALLVPAVSERLDVFRFTPCFLAGVVAFDLLRARVPRRLPPWCWPMGLAFAILLFGPADNLDIGHKLNRAWFLSLAIGVLYAFTRDARGGGVFRMFQQVAEHSYGIYLLHLIGLWLAFIVLPLRWGIPVLCIGLPVAVVVLYRYFEKPLTRYGVDLSRSIQNHRAGPTRKGVVPV